MKINQKKVGVVLSYGTEAVKVLSGLVYTPIMIRLLGQSEYGLYQLVYSVVSYLSLLSLGFNASYMRFYSRYKAKQDGQEIAKLNGMFMMIFLVMSFICLLCGGVLISNIHGMFGTGLTESEYSTAKVLMILMVINLAITFPSSVFDCSITAHEEFVFQKGVLFLQSLLNPFLTLPLLLMGMGSVGMVVMTTLLTYSKFFVCMLFCLKKLKIKFIYQKLDFGLLKEMWVFTFFIFLNQIISQINWSVDKFLLGRMSGTLAVAIYGIGGQLNSMYIQFSTAISNVFVPQVNKIVAEKKSDKELTLLFTKIGRVQFIILALISTALIFLGKPFINWWAGDGYNDSYYIALLLILPETIPLIQNIGIEIQRAKNMHKARSVVYFLIALGNVALSIELITYFGGIGAAIGTALAIILGNVCFMNWYYHRRIGIDIIYFWKQIIKFLPALVLPCVVGTGIMLFANVNGFISLATYVVIYSLVYSISMWFLGMNDYEKKLILGPLGKMQKR